MPERQRHPGHRDLLEQGRRLLRRRRRPGGRELPGRRSGRFASRWSCTWAGNAASTAIAGSAGPPASRSRPSSSAVTGRRANAAACRDCSTWSGVPLHRAEPGRARRSGWTSSRSPRWPERAGRQRDTEAGPGVGRRASPGALGAPLIVKPRFGGSSIGVELVDDVDSARALAQVQPAVRRRGAGGAVPQGLVRRQRRPSGPGRNCSCRRSSGRSGGPARCCPTSDKYVPDEGMAGAARELPAALGPDVAAAVVSQAPAVADGRRRARGRPDRLHDRRRERAGQRDQHDPRLAGPVPVDRPGDTVLRGSSPT